jgi:hypothetical protein
VKRLRTALLLSFLAHGAAMLLMAAVLLPMVPGGGGTDAERIARIVATPWKYRLGWAGWQVTALANVWLAIAMVRASRSKAAIAQLVLTGLAVIPDQVAQLLLVTRGVELARTDRVAFLAFEAWVFPLTSAGAALLYTGAAIAWTICLRSMRVWSRAIAWVSVPMLALFVAISVGPLLPRAIGPSPELVGVGNGIAFSLLEIWFVLLLLAMRRDDVTP